MSYTPEPWEYSCSGGLKGDVRSATTGRWICLSWGIGNVKNPYKDAYRNECAENAKRIVACVNACEGISTKTLEHANAHRERLNGINTAYTIASGERDELLQAMKKIVSMWDDIYPAMESGKYPQERLEHAEFTEILAARSLISKIEGK